MSLQHLVSCLCVVLAFWEDACCHARVFRELSMELQCLMSLCRCFTFGIGQNACRRLVQGLATVSKGTAEFLADGERLQPKVLISSFVLLS